MGRAGAVAAAAVLVLGAACGGGSQVRSTPTTAAGTAPTTAAPAPAGAVPDVLQFTATGVDGTPVVGAGFAGRDVALWFWAPW